MLNGHIYVTKKAKKKFYGWLKNLFFGCLLLLYPQPADPNMLNQHNILQSNVYYYNNNQNNLNNQYSIHIDNSVTNSSTTVVTKSFGQKDNEAIKQKPKAQKSVKPKATPKQELSKKGAKKPNKQCK